MLKVGLTGGIGSGKSSVARIFAEQGIEVIDSDQIARSVVEPGTSGLAQLVTEFGTEIISDGVLNRSALRQIVFNDSEKLASLNGILHPLIRQQTQQAVEQASSPYLILDIPLLFENNLEPTVDRILVVDVSEKTQIERVVKRDKQTTEQVAAIIAKQVSRATRIAGADDCIDNSGEPEALKSQVLELHKKYLSLASSKDI